MSEFKVVVDIKASPDRVLTVLRDVEHWPEWTTTMTSVKRMDAGPIMVGSRAQVRQPNLLPAVWQVTGLDERGFTWVARSPGIQVEAGHVVEENGSSSKVTLSIRYTGVLAPLVAWFYGNLTQRYVDTEADGLKKRSEFGR
jgi:uncharacterized membrane protein